MFISKDVIFLKYIFLIILLPYVISYIFTSCSIFDSPDSAVNTGDNSLLQYLSTEVSLSHSIHGDSKLSLVFSNI